MHEQVYMKHTTFTQKLACSQCQTSMRTGSAYITQLYMHKPTTTEQISQLKNLINHSYKLPLLMLEKKTESINACSITNIQTKNKQKVSLAQAVVKSGGLDRTEWVYKLGLKKSIKISLH